MNNIQKKAADSPLWLLAPGSGILLGKTPDVSGLPRLARNDINNQAAWNTVGATITASGIAAAAALIANKLAESKLERKRKQIHTNKVNALMPLSTPNYAPDISAVAAVRNLGVSTPKKEKEEENKLSKAIEQIKQKLLTYTEDILPSKEEEKHELKKAADGLIPTQVLPALATIPAALLTHTLVNKELEEERKEDLDEEIEELRNRLDSLHAELLETYRDERGVVKAASGGLLWNDENTGALQRVGAVMLASTALAFAIPAVGAYMYTKKSDKARKKLEVLEKKVLAQNLTNIPDSLSVVVGEDEKIPKTRKEQKYIEELAESSKSLI